ncbi:hypothetical protein BN59_00871 [Legionella massiliensis]|uniref:Uncharacterized protein n=1 Tax=Legionella massiliensis TaxID=1034943 RepID=A0A078KUD1_9GAMM|nr:hypothetical protein [Legionella massiliensis]CDZ76597.1 hypothetical protein BN59_00871 [Legionella massiliensis]CEE12335.1 hypothetical protein BN1094_00871 [Legionella massiliensis]
MKTIIIDWDFPPNNVEKALQDLLRPDCRIVLTSGCKDVETIINELRERNLYPTQAELEQNLVILSYEELIEDAENPAANNGELGEIQYDLLDAYSPDNLTKSETTFISTNRKAREAVKDFAENRESVLPQPTLLKPYQANPSDFAMRDAERVYSSTGNTFVSSDVYTVTETRDDSSVWYAKKKDISKLPRVQLEVFISETYRMLLGNHLPQSKYLLSEDGKHAIVLSKEVEGFTNMNNPQPIAKLEENGFKGVLPTLFLSMFLEEADLRVESMGVDSKGNFVKIDNDGAIATLIFNVKGTAAEQYSFSQEDLENPHNPQNFESPNWQTEDFHNKELKTEANMAELYGLWQKMLLNKPAIFQLLEDTIDDPTCKQQVTAKITAKFQRFEQMLVNHPGYNQFLANQVQPQQQSYKTNLTELRQEQEPDLTTEPQRVLTS